MPWITPDDITDVYGESVVVTQAFIDHVQSLAEVCVGEIDDDDVTGKLSATFVDVVYRKHLAVTRNPDGVTQEALGPYSYSMSNAPGLGLTDSDCKRLKKAAGVSSLWVQPITRGPLETAGPGAGEWEDPLSYLTEESSS